MKYQYQVAASNPKWWLDAKWNFELTQEADDEESGADNHMQAVEAVAVEDAGPHTASESRVGVS